MPLYWVRNKKGQIAAEISEKGLSVHDQGLSWQLHRMKQAGGIPVQSDDGGEERVWNLDALLRYMEESGYTVEPRESKP